MLFCAPGFDIRLAHEPLIKALKCVYCHIDRLIYIYIYKLDSIIGNGDEVWSAQTLFLLCPHRGAFAQNVGPCVVFHCSVRGLILILQSTFNTVYS